ncbi:hypothetical protein JCM15457_162 [Liquorilactobacillus sucicola DSM 21376 = JCM 15457]|uniref:IrrE N-terminal-like domain-containing protein n=1 Tax=Liquorilactobacillus sucicola DSM 21376 = JCM 15457 TaxID=1423806 RepID=A0A023CU03_9LACO|nr:ImmA/IrrE family metallo-endopeptidase [Liquorilactobacillus sucicola]KRN05243.1 hypothetical protein FD15_GL001789 [Liquorilactobacillus sucicola DSM 21376 = JCM 15457]GAJ25303.1 hypothetical protein JCM15457_162 [Liquorilactobacillus sucicola DSM 21376 = JCM 15457]
MKKMILDSLLSKAKTVGVCVVWSKDLKQDTPPTASFKYKTIVMNDNWRNRDEFIFQLAHELAHILTGDPYDAALYQRTFKHHALIEHKANIGAIKLLLPFYCDYVNQSVANAPAFVKLFCIPTHLTEDVSRLMCLYYDEKLASCQPTSKFK